MEMVDGEREARFRRTYLESFGRVHAYATRRVGLDAADEVTAEVFLVAWRRFDTMSGDPLPWLYGVARNVILRYRATQARQDRARHALESERVVTEPFEAGDRLLWVAWEQLSPSDREILTLIAWEELTVREAAVVIGCGTPVFSVRLYRARKRLERLIERQVATPGQVSNLLEER
jgi:RNA polymerase sigma-70 factor, ECF subfamily